MNGDVTQGHVAATKQLPLYGVRLERCISKLLERDRMRSTSRSASEPTGDQILPPSQAAAAALRHSRAPMLL